jgi:hypothetical protein
MSRVKLHLIAADDADSQDGHGNHRLDEAESILPNPFLSIQL